MKSRLPEPEVIRQYLLGRLNEQEELEVQLSEQILSNDDLAELVESVEEEIIDQYVDGTLDPTDRKAVEAYFLRPPERKEKLRFARLLRGYFDSRTSDLVDPVVAQWATRFRAYWPAAALILLATVGATYISRVSRREASLEAQLMQERARFASVANSTPLRPMQPAMSVLTLVLGRTRSARLPIPHIEISHSTKRVIVEIVLPTGAFGPHEVRLESDETKTVVWSARLLPLVSPDGARLLFDVPDENIKSGIYSFKVSSGDGPTTTTQNAEFQVRFIE